VNRLKKIPASMPKPFHTSTARPFSGQTACLFIHQEKNGERRRKRNLYLVTSRNHLLPVLS
jgi:hypothetical protein